MKVIKFPSKEQPETKPVGTMKFLVSSSGDVMGNDDTEEFLKRKKRIEQEGRDRI